MKSRYIGLATALVAGGMFHGGSAQISPLWVRSLPPDANGCPVLEVGFDDRLQLGQAVPAATGGLEVTLATVASDTGAPPPRPVTQTVSVPASAGVGSGSLRLDTTGDVPRLEILLAPEVKASVAEGGAGRVLVTLAAPSSPAACRAAMGVETAAVVDTGANPVAVLDTIEAEQAATEGAGPTTLTPEDEAAVEKAYARAREAIIAGDNRTAIAQLTKVLSYPENRRTPAAQELLGLVRERNGQFAHAKAEYQIYLQKYPDSEGATRVRQRLAAIETAESAPPAPLRAPKSEVLAEGGIENGLNPNLTPFEDVRVERPTTARSSAVRRRRAPRKEEEFPKIESWGSLSATYFYNQGATVLSEFETGRETKDDFVFDNSLVTALEYEWTKEERDRKLGFRISAAHDADFTSGGGQELHLSRLYGDYEQKDTGLGLRFGRQTLYSSGVYGRFDGLRASWAANDKVKLNFQTGSPVDSVRDGLFQFDKIFYGVSAELSGLLPDLDITAYAYEQRVDSHTDRQAVGFEFTHTSENLTLAGVFDYDTYFNEVNFARITTTRNFPDRSSLSLTLDYVLSPSLTLSNALQGQTATTIDELLLTYSLGEVTQLARDRTTGSASATVAYFRPLNETWQASFDTTIFYSEGNPASGGVPAVPSPGTDFFFSAGLYGNNVLRGRDVVSSTFRYANTSASTLYLLDSYYRVQTGPQGKLRVKPRMKLGYRELHSTGGHEILAFPSINAEYAFDDKTSGEVEVGDRFTVTRQSGTKLSSSELFVFLGVRRDF